MNHRTLAKRLAAQFPYALEDEYETLKVMLSDQFLDDHDILWEQGLEEIILYLLNKGVDKFVLQEELEEAHLNNG